jgi:hypothetical protein
VPDRGWKRPFDDPIPLRGHADKLKPEITRRHKPTNGDVDYVKVFANVEAAERWFEEHDPEGVAFEYDVLE